MKKYLLLPFCLTISAIASSANANTPVETPSINQTGSVVDPFSKVWDAKTEDKMTSDANYWSSKGMVESARSKALDLEAKNIAKVRNIKKLNEEPHIKQDTLESTLNKFLDGSVLAQKTDSGDNAGQEKLLEAGVPFVTKADKNMTDLKKQQDVFLSQVTDFVNRKLEEHDKKVATDAADSTIVTAVPVVVSQIPQQPDLKATMRDSKFKYAGGEESAKTVVITGKIVDIRKGYTNVVFAIVKKTNGDDDSANEPSFMQVRINPTTKVIPVTADFGDVSDVQVLSYKPNNIVFSFNDKQFNATI